jgi:hypothetical protein
VVPTDDELLELVEQRRFDDLHDVVTVEQVAEAWLADRWADVGKLGWAAVLWYDEPDESRRRALLATQIGMQMTNSSVWLPLGCSSPSPQTTSRAWSGSNGRPRSRPASGQR